MMPAGLRERTTRQRGRARSLALRSGTGTLRYAALIAPLLTLVASPAAAAPTFDLVDVTAAVGITHVRAAAVGNACDHGRCALPWAGGVAAEDIDQDGDLDLYFTMDAGPGRLYQNQGGTFVDITDGAGLGSAPVGGGVSLVDIDGDGDRDLIVNPISTTAFPTTRPYLYLSDASERAAGSTPSFLEVGEARGLVVPRTVPTSGMGVVVGDYDRDGGLDLYFADWRTSQFMCSDVGARLFRSARGAPGHFVHASVSAGVWGLTTEGFLRPHSFGGSFTDFDQDGFTDLLVTSDFDSSELYWGHASGAFVAGGRAAGVATEHTGMGSTVADYDNDGDLDLFVSAIYKANDPWDGNRLYRYEGSRAFSDQTDAAGLRDVGWAWGAVFSDLDNDGDVDLCVSSGVRPGPSAIGGFEDDETRVFLNPNAMAPWEEVGHDVGVSSLREGRQVIALDYDGDGDQDLLVVQHAGPPALLRNDASSPADWLDVRVVGGGGNVDGIGARVQARASDGRQQLREIGSREHFLGHGPRTAHFGFGAGFFAGGGTVDIHVRFPDGREAVRANLTASARVTVDVADASGTPLPPLAVPPDSDCDADGFPDQCQADCDADGRADTCQLAAEPSLDCDDDGLIDSCAISLGLAYDCDADGLPDACELGDPCASPSDAGVDPSADASVRDDAGGDSDLGSSADADAPRDLAPPTLDQAPPMTGDLGARPRGGAGCAVLRLGTPREALAPWLAGLSCLGGLVRRRRSRSCSRRTQRSQTEEPPYG